MIEKRSWLLATLLAVALALSATPASAQTRFVFANESPYDTMDPHAAFDAVVCQFGLMFFPDKAAGVREAFRVLKPGGAFAVSVWDRLEDNPVPLITHETVAAFFPDDPPQFYRVPFSLHDVAVVRGLLTSAGFVDVRDERVQASGVSDSTADAARGLIEGNPIYQAIMERRPAALAEIEGAVAAKLAAALGDRPLRCPLQAIFFSGRRPA